MMLVCVTCSTVTQDANPFVISINNKIFLISFVLKGNGYKDMKNSPPWLKERRNYSHGNEFPYQTPGPILFASLRAKRMGDPSPNFSDSTLVCITIKAIVRENQMVNQSDSHKIRCGIQLLCYLVILPAWSCVSAWVVMH